MPPLLRRPRPRPAASTGWKTAGSPICRSTGGYADVPARRGRLAAGRREARRRASGEERLGQPVGPGRRRRLPRGPHQDERHRSGRAGDGRQRRSLVAKAHKALVVYNEGSHFSAGRQPRPGAVHRQRGRLGAGRGDVRAKARRLFSQAEAAPFPVVAAPSGMALGGGCELLLHADAIQAHVESYVGLVEAGVG